ncbi:hypothetical protein SDC9_209002 [bioreactor metagenome]|uniref:Uncharacterized protein n=1 Tax=bioreactor metagenome TaxID=1076179 RepID=A0A645JD53_9ZZZZ
MAVLMLGQGAVVMRPHDQQGRSIVLRAKAGDQVFVLPAIHLEALPLRRHTRLRQLGRNIVRGLLQNLRLVKAAAQKILAQHPHMRLQAFRRNLQPRRQADGCSLRHGLGQHAAADTADGHQRGKQGRRASHPFAGCAVRVGR